MQTQSGNQRPRAGLTQLQFELPQALLERFQATVARNRSNRAKEMRFLILHWCMISEAADRLGVSPYQAFSHAADEYAAWERRQLGEVESGEERRPLAEHGASNGARARA